MGKKISIIVLLIIIALFSVSCNKNPIKNIGNSEAYEKFTYKSADGTEHEMSYMTLHYENAWGSERSDYVDDIIKDRETAIKIAEGVWYGLPKKDYQKTFIPTIVFEDKEDKIWVVYFEKKQDGTTLDGVGCSITLSGKDGRVLKISYSYS